jgi:hypothetical protein
MERSRRAKGLPKIPQALHSVLCSWNLSQRQRTRLPELRGIIERTQLTKSGGHTNYAVPEFRARAPATDLTTMAFNTCWSTSASFLM